MVWTTQSRLICVRMCSCVRVCVGSRPAHGARSVDSRANSTRPPQPPPPPKSVPRSWTARPAHYGVCPTFISSKYCAPVRGSSSSRSLSRVVVISSYRRDRRWFYYIVLALLLHTQLSSQALPPNPLAFVVWVFYIYIYIYVNLRWWALTIATIVHRTQENRF